jgi:hypothetical protein
MKGGKEIENRTYKTERRDSNWAKYWGRRLSRMLWWLTIADEFSYYYCSHWVLRTATCSCFDRIFKFASSSLQCVTHTHTLSHVYTRTHTHSCFTYEELKLINYLDPVTQSLEALFNVFLIVNICSPFMFLLLSFFLLLKINVGKLIVLVINYLIGT